MAKGTDYSIVSKEEIRRLGRLNQPETYLRVQATTKGGVNFTLDIPDAELTNADKLLTARAKQLDAI